MKLLFLIVWSLVAARWCRARCVRGFDESTGCNECLPSYQKYGKACVNGCSGYDPPCSPNGTVPNSCSLYDQCVCLPGIGGPFCTECDKDFSCGKYSLPWVCSTSTCNCLDGISGNTCDMMLSGTKELPMIRIGEHCNSFLLQEKDTEPCPCGQIRNGDSCVSPGKTRPPFNTCLVGTPNVNQCMSVAEAELTGTHEIAESACKSLDSSLLSIPTPQAAASLKLELSKRGHDFAWVGLSWDTIEGARDGKLTHWSDGNIFDINSVEFEDDITKFLEEKESCIYISVKTGKLGSMKCDSLLSVVCQMPMLPIGCPSGYVFDWSSKICHEVVESASSTCDEASGYTPFHANSSLCVKKYDNALDFQTAEDTCQKEGGHLVFGRTRADVLALKPMLESMNMRQTWIGLQHNIDLGLLEWTTGEIAHVEDINGFIRPKIGECTFLTLSGPLNTVCGATFEFVCMRKSQGCPPNFLFFDGRCVKANSEKQKAYTEKAVCVEYGLTSGDLELENAARVLSKDLAKCLEQSSGDQDSILPNGWVSKLAVTSSFVAKAHALPKTFVLAHDKQFSSSSVFEEADLEPNFSRVALSFAFAALANHGPGLTSYLTILPATPRIMPFLDIMMPLTNNTFRLCLRGPCPCGMMRSLNGKCVEQFQTWDHQLEVYMGYARCAALSKEGLEKMTLQPIDVFLSRSATCMQQMVMPTSTQRHLVSRALGQVRDLVGKQKAARLIEATVAHRLEQLVAVILQQINTVAMSKTTVPAYATDILHDRIKEEIAKLDRMSSKNLQRELFQDQAAFFQSKLVSLQADITKRLFEVRVDIDSLHGALADVTEYISDEFALQQKQDIRNTLTDVNALQMEYETIRSALVEKGNQISMAVAQLSDHQKNMNTALTSFGPILKTMLTAQQDFFKAQKKFQNAEQAYMEAKARLDKIKADLGVAAMIGGILITPFAPTLGLAFMMAPEVVALREENPQSSQSSRKQSSEGTRFKLLLDSLHGDFSRNSLYGRNQLKEKFTEYLPDLEKQIPSTYVPAGASAEEFLGKKSNELVQSEINKILRDTATIEELNSGKTAPQIRVERENSSTRITLFADNGQVLRHFAVEMPESASQTKRNSLINVRMNDALNSYRKTRLIQIGTKYRAFINDAEIGRQAKVNEKDRTNSCGSKRRRLQSNTPGSDILEEWLDGVESLQEQQKNAERRGKLSNLMQTLSWALDKFLGRQRTDYSHECTGTVKNFVCGNVVVSCCSSEIESCKLDTAYIDSDSKVQCLAVEEGNEYGKIAPIEETIESFWLADCQKPTSETLVLPASALILSCCANPAEDIVERTGKCNLPALSSRIATILAANARNDLEGRVLHSDSAATSSPPQSRNRCSSSGGVRSKIVRKALPAVGSAALLLGVYLTSTQPPEFPDHKYYGNDIQTPIHTDMLNFAMKNLQLATQKIGASVFVLLRRFMILLMDESESEYEGGGELDSGNELPVVWDQYYEETLRVLEYEFELCPKERVTDERRRLQEAMSMRGSLKDNPRELRAVLNSKKEAEEAMEKAQKEAEEAQAEMDKQHGIYVGALKELRGECGKFLLALRMVTTWGKAIHQGLFDMVEAFRQTRLLQAKQRFIMDKAEESVNEMVGMRHRAKGLVDRLKYRKPLKENLPDFSIEEAVFELVTVQEQIRAEEDAVYALSAASELLLDYCAAAMYALPKLKSYLVNKCILRLGQGGSASSIMSEVRFQLEELSKLVGSDLKDLYFRKLSTSYEAALDITSVIDWQTFEQKGFRSTQFALGGPPAALGDSLRPGESFLVQDPFFCREGLSLENVEMSSFGLVFLDENNNLIGHEADIFNPKDMAMSISLGDTFIKAEGDLAERFAFRHRLQMITGKSYNAYSNIQFTYHLPNGEGSCNSGSPDWLGRHICHGIVKTNLDKKLAPLPTPYTTWQINLTESTARLLQSKKVKRAWIVATLDGTVSAEVNSCPKSSKPFLSTGSMNSIEDKSNIGGIIGGVIGGVVALIAVVAVVVVIRRRRLNSSSVSTSMSTSNHHF